MWTRSTRVESCGGAHALKEFCDIVSIPVVIWYEVQIFVLQALQVFVVAIARGTADVRDNRLEHLHVGL